LGADWEAAAFSVLASFFATAFSSLVAADWELEPALSGLALSGLEVSGFELPETEGAEEESEGPLVPLLPLLDEAAGVLSEGFAVKAAALAGTEAKTKAPASSKAVARKTGGFRSLLIM
jgi:hypothetical protein